MNAPKSMEELADMQRQDNTSLGIVKPKQIIDLIIEPDKEEWKSKWKAEMEQLHLFAPERKPLEKIPYKFSYKFTCDDPRCKGHKKVIEDWEVGQLYLNELKRLGDRERATESVREKFLNVMCAPSKDTHFFVGTVLEYGTWIVLGVFWPPLQKKPVARKVNSQ